MMSKLDYKGFSSRVDFSGEDEAFVGKVLDVDSLILFSATDVDGLKREFHQAIDAYLEHCKVQGVSPEKPCKGTFNVRIGPELHRRVATIARAANRSLNDFVREAVRIRVQECMQFSNAHEEPIFLERFPLRTGKELSPWSDVVEAHDAVGSQAEDRSRVYN